MSRVLYILACGAPPARDVGVLAGLAQDREWDACVVTSGRGRTFVDADTLEAMTGHPVRSGYKNPGEPEVLPPTDALIVAPATTNTINKWAAGISDALPLGLLVEGIGKSLPIVAMPFTNRAQAAHPVFEPNIDRLRSWGVTVLYGPEVYPLHEPGAGWETIARFPWHLTLDALDALTPAASLRCQASSVAGVTGKVSAQDVRGMSRASAANHALSAGSYRTRPI